MLEDGYACKARAGLALSYLPRMCPSQSVDLVPGRGGYSVRLAQQSDGDRLKSLRGHTGFCFRTQGSATLALGNRHSVNA